MAEDISTLPAASTPLKPPQRTNPHDIRNSDLVSRFLAATPPYLYSPPAGPHNFFFSEMLRSLVQAKANEQTARNLSQLNRQSRKRTWNRFSHDVPKSGNLKELKEPMEKPSTDKPLQLTNKLVSSPFAVAAQQSKIPKESGSSKFSNSISDVVEKKSNITAAHTSSEPPGNEPNSAALSPSDLVLPPPPPMWYPPLYPPYGIDPLHFFIDLRVSAAGHIYDRKKENTSPSNDNNNTSTPAKFDADAIGKPRLGSAFSVPPPRREKSPLALNLTSSPGAGQVSDKSVLADYRNSLFLMEAEKEAALKNAKNTNYVLQNLPRIYTTMMPPSGSDDHHSVISDGSDSKSEADLNDIDVKDEEREFSASDDVVIVDCQDMDDALTDNNNSKHISF